MLSPLGITLEGVALAETDIAQVQHLLAEYGFVVFRGESVDDGDFVAFLRRFGPLQFTVGEPALADFPDLNVVSNVGRTAAPRSVFHVDTSYVARPPAYTALRAVEIPSFGGETLFTNQYLAYDSLPESTRRLLRGRSIMHVVSGLPLHSGDERAAEHLAARRHPISGRTALYLSTPERCVAVSGMGEQEARTLIAALFAHSTKPHNVYRHAWATGDVVMWDNRCVMHRADHTDVTGNRVLHRGMVAETGPSDAGTR